MFTHRYKTDSVRCCKYVINLISTQFNIKVRYFYVNRETSLSKEQTKYNELWDFNREKGIIVEISAPRT